MVGDGRRTFSLASLTQHRKRRNGRRPSASSVATPCGLAATHPASAAPAAERCAGQQVPQGTGQRPCCPPADGSRDRGRVTSDCAQRCEEETASWEPGSRRRHRAGAGAGGRRAQRQERDAGTFARPPCGPRDAPPPSAHSLAPLCCRVTFRVVASEPLGVWLQPRGVLPPSFLQVPSGFQVPRKSEGFSREAFYLKAAMTYLQITFGEVSGVIAAKSSGHFPEEEQDVAMASYCLHLSWTGLQTPLNV